MQSLLDVPITLLGSFASRAKRLAPNVRQGLLLALLGAAAIMLTACNSASPDREALVTLYNATDGDNWKNNDNWLSDAPIGEWYGVTTDNQGRVLALSLSDNWLSEEIPPELGSLFRLRRLTVSHNRLTDEIPRELGSLSRLEFLAINDNHLSGDVPSELGDLTNLNRLYIADNRLSGCIPSNLRGILTFIDRIEPPFCYMGFRR